MQTQPETKNGFDQEQMQQTVAALQADPKLARFEFRATNRWMAGGLNRSSIQSFYGAGGEDESRQAPFTYDNAEPPVLLGANESANPVEFVLHALAGCLTTTFALHATARGIDVRSISTQLEGELDLNGFLALDPEATVGYERLRVRMQVDADADDDVIEELIAFSQSHSPVFQTLAQPIPVTVERC